MISRVCMLNFCTVFNFYDTSVQYFLPFEKKRINKLIEQAILEAQRDGARVISLGALNKVSFTMITWSFFLLS